ncbi:GIY-YIG nuclease family protein [Anaerocolumna aminovalerica]|uniref:GIY-YIG nuclease family protein n=1 Tax=Anaerocolumna aminovalerica TaxID=1527 RepID=UPI001C0F1F22|nr:GIY-YIG nuclease family protein [Anaerocolumna aminovalerica]MBU5332107.1 GIY-YIG nuclease family protein [Anaerocolumna aminovalerica]
MYNELKNINEDKEMGYVYVLYNPESKLVKIGKTKDPRDRLLSLSNQNGTKMKYYITDQMYIETIVERIMHNKFDRFRCAKGEWFKNISFNDVVKTLKELCNSEDFKRRNYKKNNRI